MNPYAQAFRSIAQIIAPMVDPHLATPTHIWVNHYGAQIGRIWTELHDDAEVHVFAPAEAFRFIHSKAFGSLDPGWWRDDPWCSFRLAHEVAHTMFWRLLPPSLREIARENLLKPDYDALLEAEAYALLGQVIMAEQLDAVGATGYHAGYGWWKDICEEPMYRDAAKLLVRLWTKQAEPSPILRKALDGAGWTERLSRRPPAAVEG